MIIEQCLHGHDPLYTSGENDDSTVGDISAVAQRAARFIGVKQLPIYTRQRTTRVAHTFDRPPYSQTPSPDPCCETPANNDR